MNQILNIVVESFAQEKERHIINAATTGTAATVSATGTFLGDFLGFLPVAGMIAGPIVYCYLVYKTYLDIKLLKIKLAKEDRRHEL